MNIKVSKVLLYFSILSTLIIFCPLTSAEDEPPFWIAMLQSGVRASYDGNYEKAERLFKSVLEEADKETLPSKKIVINALAYGNLGQLYNEMGRYDLAEQYINRSISLKEKFMPPNDPMLLSDLNNLGMLYRVQERYAEADACYLRIIPAFEKIYIPGKSPDYAKVLNNYAESLRYQKKYDKSEALYKKAIAIHLQDGEKSLTAIPLANLGEIYYAKEEYPKAAQVLNESLEILEKSFPENHPYIGTTLNSLGNVYSRLGKFDEAENSLKKAIEIHKAALGLEHIQVAQDLNNLAVLYADYGKLQQAEPLLFQALEIYKKSLGENHDIYKKTLKNYQTLQSDITKAQ